MRKIILISILFVNNVYSQIIEEKQDLAVAKIKESKRLIENFQFNKAEEALKKTSVYSLRVVFDKDDFYFSKFFIELHKDNFDKAEDYYNKIYKVRTDHNKIITKYADSIHYHAIAIAKNNNYNKASKKAYLSHRIRKKFASPFSPKSLYKAAAYAELGKAYNDAIKYNKLILYNGYTRKYDYVAWDLKNNKEYIKKTYKNKYARDKAIKNNNFFNPSRKLTEDYKKYFLRLFACYFKNNDIATAKDLVHEEIKNSPFDKNFLTELLNYIKEKSK